MSVEIPPERSDEERLTKIRRDEARWKPGTLAYAALAVLVAIALILSAVTGVQARNKSFRATAANCRVTEALSVAFIDLLNKTTTPRILGKGATPTQVAAQAEVNAAGRAYRETELARLRALSCSKLEVGDQVAVRVSVPSPPPTVVGPAGDRGSAGLVGPAGLKGGTGPEGPQGPAGTVGKPGADGTNGANGGNGPGGPPGPPGPAGANGTNGTDGAPGPLPPSFAFTVDLQTVTCVLDVDTYTCTTSPTP